MTNQNEHDQEPVKPRRGKRKSFEIEDRLVIYIDYDLACELKQVLENAKVTNPALWALMCALPKE